MICCTSVGHAAVAGHVVAADRHADAVDHHDVAVADQHVDCLEHLTARLGEDRRHGAGELLGRQRSHWPSDSCGTSLDLSHRSCTGNSAQGHSPAAEPLVAQQVLVAAPDHAETTAHHRAKQNGCRFDAVPVPYPSSTPVVSPTQMSAHPA